MYDKLTLLLLGTATIQLGPFNGATLEFTYVSCVMPHFHAALMKIVCVPGLGFASSTNHWVLILSCRDRSRSGDHCDKHGVDGIQYTNPAEYSFDRRCRFHIGRFFCAPTSRHPVFKWSFCQIFSECPRVC